jgi:hypothetical protein
VKKIYLSLAMISIMIGFSMSAASQNRGQEMRVRRTNQSEAKVRMGSSERQPLGSEWLSGRNQVLSGPPVQHLIDTSIRPRHGSSNRAVDVPPREVCGTGADVWEHATRNNQGNQTNKRISNRALISVSVDPMTDTPERLKVNRVLDRMNQKNDRFRQIKPAVFEPNNEWLWLKRKRAGPQRNIPIEFDSSKW